MEVTIKSSDSVVSRHSLHHLRLYLFILQGITVGSLVEKKQTFGAP